MAELCIARATGVHGFEKYVAIKRILPKWADDREFVEMFLDEARLAAQLDHPNVVHVHDLGEDSDAPFFAMDYIHGENLLAIIGACRERGAPLGWSAFVAIASAAAAGLHHAHERCGFDGEPLGIIHRDVSPTNVIASYEGALKIVDFGIAKAATSRHATRPSVRKGKMAYMSPEQCRGEALDRRSDLFALGIVLYELATLTRAFDGDGEFAVMNQIVNHDIEPPSNRSPVPEDVESIILRLLARDREDRFGTGREVQRALDGAASSMGLSATPAAIAAEMESLFGSRAFPWVGDVSAPTDPAGVALEAETVSVEGGTAATVAKAAPVQRPRVEDLGVGDGGLVAPSARRRWVAVVGAVVVLGAAAVVLWPREQAEVPATDEARSARVAPAEPVVEPTDPPVSVLDAVARNSGEAPVAQVAPATGAVDPETGEAEPETGGGDLETSESVVVPPEVDPPRPPEARHRPPRSRAAKPSKPSKPAEPPTVSFDPDAPAPRPR